ncbi:MAG TPA: mechanosensitive ion channel domain-containing protein [Polyangiaceae bacterium]
MTRLLAFEFWEPLLGALLGAVIALAGGAAVAWVLVFVFRRWAQQTATTIDDLVVKQLATPLRWLLPLLALFFALRGLDLSEQTRGDVKQVLVVAMTLCMSWVFFRVVRVFEEVVGERANASGSLRARSAYTQVRGLSNVLRFLIGLATIGLVLLSFAEVRQLGVSMLASAGVAGIVIGFAAQKTLSTVVSGLVLAVSQPIRIDDAIFVEGELGIVEEIGLTFVTVRLLDRRCIVLPVNYFLEKPFQNWSRSSSQVRSGVDLYLDYSAPLDRIREEHRRIVEASAHWDKDVCDLSVARTSERGMVVTATASAADARKAASLRGEVREKLVTFIQTHFPNAFPRMRADFMTANGGAGSPTTPNP